MTMNQGGCYKALTPPKKCVNCLVNALPNNNNDTCVLVLPITVTTPIGKLSMWCNLGNNLHEELLA